MVKAAKSNRWVWDYAALIVEKVGTKWQGVKKRGKYDKGLFVSTEENEDYQEEETKKFAEERTFDSNDSARSIEELHDPLKNMVIED